MEVRSHRVLLDTSGYSAFLKGNSRIKSLLQQVDEIYLNTIILGELLAGFTAGSHEKKNRDILRELLSSPRVSVAHLDEETAERYANIYCYLRAQGTPVPVNDLWIAATAMQYGLKIVTLDSHFLKIPQVLTEYCSASE